MYFTILLNYCSKLQVFLILLDYHKAMRITQKCPIYYYGINSLYQTYYYTCPVYLIEYFVEFIARYFVESALNGALNFLLKSSRNYVKPSHFYV